MIEAAESVERFVTERRRADLDSDEMLLFAVVQALQIIGEAASRISQQTRLAAPSVPWPLIIGMRNRLIHAYADINRDIVWRTATAEVPTLIPLLASLLPAK